MFKFIRWLLGGSDHNQIPPEKKGKRIPSPVAHQQVKTRQNEAQRHRYKGHGGGPAKGGGEGSWH